MNNSDGVICADGWSGLSADVICRQLGYTAARFSAGTISKTSNINLAYFSGIVILKNLKNVLGCF